MKNKKLLLSAIATATLFGVGAIGGTVAFFTSSTTHNITATTAKVNLTSEIKADTLKTYSLGVEQEAGKFENVGSTAEIDSNGVLTLNNVAPGDKATFDVVLSNSSTIEIRYSAKIAVVDENGDPVASHPFVVTGAKEGRLLPTVSEETINVGIELPDTVTGDELEGVTYIVKLTIDAIQANAPVAVSTAQELKDEIAKGNNVELTQDITLDAPLAIDSTTVSNGQEITIEGNGKTLASTTGTRVINVADVTDVTLNVVDVVAGETGKERCISAFNAKNTTINVVGSTLTARAYSVNLASDCDGSTVNIADSEITGWCFAQSWSKDSTFNVTNSKLHSLNIYSGTSNSFAAFVINEPATNNIVNITNSTFTSQATGDQKQYFFSFRSTGTKLNMHGTNTFEWLGNGTDASIKSWMTELWKYDEGVEVEPGATVSGNVVSITASEEHEGTFDVSIEKLVEPTTVETANGYKFTVVS